MQTLHKITPCLWFDNQAEEAARFYTAIFPNSKIGSITRYGKEGYEIHRRPAGTVMTVEFEIEGQTFTALNGGPVFKFNEAISFQVQCETQAEVDEYWEKLSEGGDEQAQQCGWLKDKFGVLLRLRLLQPMRLEQGGIVEDLSRRPIGDNAPMIHHYGA